ncbi:MAG: D-glycero-beta-D-manno-heptose-7-phosphate kinase [Verrucomicrobiales bacterium]|nr:D-glycero-beta-D-manno-heptose-7-phosphate kinase [Verrucomicrobiales bacterium]
MKTLSLRRVRDLLSNAAQTRVLVIGDLMLDQFIWGTVRRISPEAPVPVVEFQRESFMPGGAANVARNLTMLGVATELFGVVGPDDAGKTLKSLLVEQQVGCDGFVEETTRQTSIKTRVIAHQQQMVRVDRETVGPLDDKLSERLLNTIEKRLSGADALIIGDYGKGVISQPLLDRLKTICRDRAIFLSLDPKPVHHLNLQGLSLITPNRKEAFELAEIPERGRADDPLKDADLLLVSQKLLATIQPALLLITLGDQGMLLCRRNEKPFHIPTVAQEVFDVSGAGDTVIASFTAAIAAGASPGEAAIFSNHAAGVVVGKVGTAVVSPEEVLQSFKSNR